MPILRRLSGPADIEEFIEGYERASGRRVPAGCLHSSVVFGMRRRGRLIGGLIIAPRAPFRTVAFVPEAGRAAVTAAIEGTDAIELTCVWDASSDGATVASSRAPSRTCAQARSRRPSTAVSSWVLSCWDAEA